MRFSRDRRGQSVVIGTVILFGFLILALSLYQVQIVPQQNAQVEFQHFEEVRNDLVELRAGILQAGSTDRPQYQTVRLGTSYSTRLFAINPPAPAGTIRTTESYPITISNGSGTPEGTVTIPTRFIQYRPGYNEIDQSPTWYDASVLYVDARDEGGGVAVIEDQELVDSDETVRIIALQNEFRRSGTGRVTIELRPAENISETLPEGDDLTVTIPTRLNESDWESKTDLTDSAAYDSVTDTGADLSIDNSNIYNLTLSTSTANLTVDTVGVQEAPNDPKQNSEAAVGGRGDDSDGSTSNNVWTDCPVPPSPPAQGEAGVIYISSSPSNNINANGDTVVIEDGVAVSRNINNPGAVFIGDDATVSVNIGASGDIVLGENAQLSGNVNDGDDFYLLPGSSTSNNVDVSGTIYLDSRNQIGNNINGGTVQECTVA
ncbi:hypothetical protein [Halorubrum sp. SD626R]|uniref:hypothetical protein n=1 Tax=Halorubrum sp. SD626R TaxID=1419722 RepID=UPI000A83EED8|nr:hypothetical protein [Halorubrum sp. SD626R]TKX79392.1 hypothetical protein EXE53_16120 [Halorubrum sp. SD626R]